MSLDRLAVHGRPVLDERALLAIAPVYGVDSGLAERVVSRKGDAVSATVLYMSMSLDGFVAGPNEGPGNALGDEAPSAH